MAAKQFPKSWPPLVVREFKDIERAYKVLRDLVRSLDDLRRKVLEVGNDHATRIDPQTGTAAPATTPTDIGLLFLNTTAKDMYISVGTASSADWKKTTP